MTYGTMVIMSSIKSFGSKFEKGNIHADIKITLQHTFLPWDSKVNCSLNAQLVATCSSTLTTVQCMTNKVKYLTPQHQKTITWMIRKEKRYKDLCPWDHTINDYIKGHKVPIFSTCMLDSRVTSCTPQLTIQKKTLRTKWMQSTFMPYFQLKQYMPYKGAIAVYPFIPYYHQALMGG
jgi:hypothetical protein